MEAKELLSEGYGSALALMAEVLKGLSREDLDWQPKSDCNSIGWLAWHAAREQDATMAYMTREDQLWIKEGWHDKFGRPADPRDYGTGHTLEQMASFRSPDVETILNYYKAVVERTQKYILSLTAADLDQATKMKFMQPPPSVGSWLRMIMDDCIQHSGQTGYVRGLRQGIGWYKH
jgi:hypothetical protein